MITKDSETGVYIASICNFATWNSFPKKICNS